MNCRRYGVDLSPFPKVLNVEKELVDLPTFVHAHPSNQPDRPDDESKFVVAWAMSNDKPWNVKTPVSFEGDNSENKKTVAIIIGGIRTELHHVCLDNKNRCLEMFILSVIDILHTTALAQTDSFRRNDHNTVLSTHFFRHSASISFVDVQLSPAVYTLTFM